MSRCRGDGGGRRGGVFSSHSTSSDGRPNPMSCRAVGLKAAAVTLLLLPLLAPTAEAAPKKALSPPPPPRTRMPPSIRDQPNFVVVVTDDQDDVLNSTHPAYMPALNSLLGSAGTRFANTLVSTSVCCPARVSLLTGRLAHCTNVTANWAPMGAWNKFSKLDLDSDWLPGWLQEAGYRTGLVGKLLNGFKTPLGANARCPLGIDHLDALTAGTYDLYNSSFAFNCGLSTAMPGLYQTDVIRNKALTFIDNAATKGKPFYLHVTPAAPHMDNGGGSGGWRPPPPAQRHAHLYPDLTLPYNPTFLKVNPLNPSKTLDMSSPANVLAMTELYVGRLRALRAVDEMVEAIVSKLSDLGILNNTYVVFLSDNGLHMGQHGLSEGKATPLEEDSRVPLYLRGPGVAEGVVSSYQANLIDFAPTIRALAGLPLRPDLDGLPLPLEGLTMETYGAAFKLVATAAAQRAGLLRPYPPPSLLPPPLSQSPLPPPSLSPLPLSEQPVTPLPLSLLLQAPAKRSRKNTQAPASSLQVAAKREAGPNPAVTAVPRPPPARQSPQQQPSKTNASPLKMVAMTQQRWPLEPPPPAAPVLLQSPPLQWPSPMPTSASLACPPPSHPSPSPPMSPPSASLPPSSPSPSLSLPPSPSPSLSPSNADLQWPSTPPPLPLSLSPFPSPINLLPSSTTPSSDLPKHLIPTTSSTSPPSPPSSASSPPYGQSPPPSLSPPPPLPLPPSPPSMPYAPIWFREALLLEAWDSDAKNGVFPGITFKGLRLCSTYQPAPTPTPTRPQPPSMKHLPPMPPLSPLLWLQRLPSPPSPPPPLEQQQVLLQPWEASRAAAFMVPQPRDGPPLYCLKYVVWCKGNQRELYDLSHDPYEAANVLGSASAALLSRLDAVLSVLVHCRGADCAHPYGVLHPAGDVLTFEQAMDPRHDALYVSLPRFAFTTCYPGYVPPNERTFTLGMRGFPANVSWESTGIVWPLPAGVRGIKTEPGE